MCTSQLTLPLYFPNSLIFHQQAFHLQKFHLQNFKTDLSQVSPSAISRPPQSNGDALGIRFGLWIGVNKYPLHILHAALILVPSPMYPLQWPPSNVLEINKWKLNWGFFAMLENCCMSLIGSVHHPFGMT